jgi:hypothetical protein
VEEQLTSFADDVQAETQEAAAKVIRLGHGLSEPLLQWLREVESTEATHKSASAPSDPRPTSQQRRPSPPVTPPVRPHAHGPTAGQTGHSSTAVRRHKDQVIADLHTRLFATPHVVSTSGVALTRNERRMIVAAVGLCEANNDVFGSSNTDQEFKGRKFGQRGIETNYSRIVHIGLSYGYIQCTQDGGVLGALLVKMRARDEATFKTLFPNADLLIQMTTQGLPGHDHYGASGQSYWNHLPASQKHALQSRANTDANNDKRADNPLTTTEEIRGARVQKIPYVDDSPAIDLWEDYSVKPTLPDGTESKYFGYLSAFKAAGDVPIFQDVQIDFAVDNYVNPVLERCKQWRVRSSIGLAFIFACSVRGGTGSSLTKLLLRVAAAIAGSEVTSFDSAQQERECVKALSDWYDSYHAPHQPPATGSLGSGSTQVTFNKDEARRAKVLLRDEYHFLCEDLYDLATYDAAHDR